MMDIEYVNNPLQETAFLSILIVDDEPENLLLIKDILKKFKYRDIRVEYQYLNSAREVINVIKEENPDDPETAVIILDYKMPGLSGQAVIDHLREIQGNEITQIILVTAVAGEDLPLNPIETLEEKKINDYLDKATRLDKRLPISLYNALRLFEARRDEKKLLLSIWDQNEELKQLYELLIVYFSDRPNTSLDDASIPKVVDFLMEKLSGFMKTPRKVITLEAKKVISGVTNIDFGSIFRIIKTSLEDKQFRIVDETFINKWMKKNANHMIWFKDRIQLRRLYKQLIDHNMIETLDFELFQRHFSDPIIPFKKIVWAKQNQDLLHLIHELDLLYYFGPNFRERKFIEITRHFEKPGGEEIKHGSSRTLFKTKVQLEGVSIDPKSGVVIRTYNWTGNNPERETIQEIIRNLEPDSPKTSQK